MTTIVQGDAYDIGSIMPIMIDAFDPQFGEAWTAAQCMSLLTLPNSALFIAKDGDMIAGFAMTRWVLDEEELLMIGIPKALHRHKFGSQLLDHIVLRAQQAGRIKLFLEVRDGNSALSFYTYKGFHEAGRRKHYYKGSDGLSFDAITMMKIL